MVLLSVREIHDVKTLNSELRSNSQLSACILYGTRSVLADYVAKSGVLYWYSKKEGHGCCNGPNVKVECAIHI